MDDIVRQAMLKWPNVPHCYGWLGLDARGNWYLRDDRAQAVGAFASGLVGAKGSLLQHVKLIEFIQRNYACDDEGQWYFQNGPQRVYVELESTPWIWRISNDYRITAHDGREADLQQLIVDECGWVYAETNRGFGLVHTQDVLVVAEAVECGKWSAHEVPRSHIGQHYGFVVSPSNRKQIKKPVE